MTAVYLGQAATDKLAAAQAIVDRHLISCAACGTDRPCRERIEADQVFARYGCLPRRTPGLTSTAAGGGAFGWFGGR